MDGFSNFLKALVYGSVIMKEACVLMSPLASYLIFGHYFGMRI